MPGPFTGYGFQLGLLDVAMGVEGSIGALDPGGSVVWPRFWLAVVAKFLGPSASPPGSTPAV